MDAEALLRAHRPAVRDLTEALRRLVRAAVPEAIESAHFRWHSLNFRHPICGYFCGIFPQEDAVRVVFEFGVLLPDPDGVLEGEGRQTRHVHLLAGAPVPASALSRLCRAAVELPASRAEKLAMIRSSARPAYGTSGGESG